MSTHSARSPERVPRVVSCAGRLCRVHTRSAGAWGAALLVSALGGCLTNAGEPPPQALLLSPIATAMRQPAVGAPTHLLVLNSNFNLRYKGGSLHSYDLAVLNSAIDAACVAPRVGITNAECRLDPLCAVPEACVVVPDQLQNVDDAGGQLLITPTAGLLVGEVNVGSYGSSVALDAAGERAYLGIRADADITVVDIDPDGGLRCGGNAGEVHECDAASRHVDQALARARGFTLQPDPLGISVQPLSNLVAGDEGSALIVAHRSGTVSFIIDRGSSLTLVDSIDGFSTELLGASLGPDGKVWLPSSISPFVARVGVGLDGTDDVVVEDGLLYNAGLARVTGVTGDNALDARAVAFDSQGNALVLTRSPGTLIVTNGGLQPDGRLLVVASIEVGVGPSRVRVSTLHGREFAFVSCFDSRDVYVVDLVTRELAAVVRGMTGPFEFEVDAVRERAYIADFRTSVIRVVDLRPMLTCLDEPGVPHRECAPQLIGMVGRPTTLRGGF